MATIARKVITQARVKISVSEKNAKNRIVTKNMIEIEIIVTIANARAKVGLTKIKIKISSCRSKSETFNK